MPKQIIDYANTVIYKIICNDLNITDIYVGHTTNFIKRKCGHKQVCSNEKDKHHNLKVYQTIRANGGWDNWEMIEIEKYPCKDANEAKSRERFYYESLNAKLNMYSPQRKEEKLEEYFKNYRDQHKKEKQITDKIYREKNKELITEKKKQYREANKVSISARDKQYREANKENIQTNFKLYYEKHKDILKQRSKKWYDENREKVKLRETRQIICECGCSFTFNNRFRHLNTQKHKAFLETKEI